LGIEVLPLLLAQAQLGSTVELATYHAFQVENRRPLKSKTGRKTDRWRFSGPLTKRWQSLVLERSLRIQL
jgi:hypothetical protein|tara:strand:- start:269 stop:478 length:210 start_codon:yes stop_codon:yes gene_type:complete